MVYLFFVIDTMTKPPPQFIFLHIRKTGGQTLKKIIMRHYPLESFFITHNGEEKFLNELKRLPSEKKERIRCVFGHMPFGLHSFFAPRIPYITMLRDPAERILSSYFYAKNNISLLPAGDRAIERYSLQEFISLDIPAVSNYQTGVLCGAIARTDVLFDSVSLPPDALAVAKDNIKNFFALVGTTERFDETMLLFHKIFGLSPPRWYERRNVTDHRPAIADIPKSIRDTIRKRNEFDAELYAFANSWLDQKIKEYGFSFFRNLAFFKATHWLYQKKYACGKIKKKLNWQT